jgi:hypothetical protein
VGVCQPTVVVDTAESIYFRRAIGNDFATICRSLKPTSRNILVDMGASLNFHGNKTPAIYLTDNVCQICLPFDHVYAFEITRIEFTRVPDKLHGGLPLINLWHRGQPKEQNESRKMVRENFREDDLVVVKLDIDSKIQLRW